MTATWRFRALLSVCVLALAGAGAALDEGGAAGLRVQVVQGTLPYFDAQNNYEVYDSTIRGKRQNAVTAVTSRGKRPLRGPVDALVSRRRYPAEDGHLDAIVWLDAPAGAKPAGRLRVTLREKGGEALASHVLDPIPGPQLFMSPPFPDALVGRDGLFEVAWERRGEVSLSVHEFSVLPPADPPRSGRIRLVVPNATNARAEGVPFSVGVPFPRGALDDAARVKLVDEAGAEVPLQVEVRGRWSRFGSVKWTMCDFSLDLEGGPRELFLEYGPDVSRSERPPMAVQIPQPGLGLPQVEAGRVRMGTNGLSYDPGDGEFRHLIAPEGAIGAFVESAEGANYIGWGHRHMSSAGRLFQMQPSPFRVEESGPEKVTLLAEGWYGEAETGDNFCKYVTRYVFHRGSPLVRVFHTWIYTGDSDRDRIRNMGWRFALNDMAPAGFLTDYDGPKWEEGYYLRQHDPEEFALFETTDPDLYARAPEGVFPARPIREVSKGRRAPGVMAAKGQGARVFVGVKDFWQNFPRSMAFEGGGMTFYEWPRYGRTRQHQVRPDDAGNVWRLWFAHEGETLSFALPMELAEAPLYIQESGPEPHFAHGRPETVNAQGVAKTAEMWLWFAPESADPAEAAKVLQGLNEETLRAVVDPDWMVASGTFYEIHPRDTELLPEDEKVYEENVLKPIRQVERMNLYGKWIYGDLLRAADLDEQTAGLYRTFRKGHWGWPYSWIPFVRSGDARFLRFAQSATRMMADVAFCHYVSDEMVERFASFPKRRMWDDKQPFRAIGWHNRNLIPWAGYWGPSTRLYCDGGEHLWHAWYVDGYHRARDVALEWAKQSKIEVPDQLGRGPITAGWNRGRWPMNLQKQYTEMYEATFDPWFLAGAHAIADMFLHRHREEDYGGHPWTTGKQEFQRFVGDDVFGDFVLHFSQRQGDRHQQGWATTPSTLIPAVAWGWRMSGEDYFLRRAAGLLDVARMVTYSAEEPEFYRGFYAVGDTNSDSLFTSWYQTWYPLLAGMMAEAGGVPANPIYMPFSQRLEAGDSIAVQKAAGEALTLRLRGAWRIEDAQGEAAFEGDADGEVVLPEDAAGGTYFLRPQRRIDALLPVSPPDVPEVLVVAPDRWVGTGALFAQHWFRVPEGVERFWIEFENPPLFRQSVRQIAVADADGREAWAHRQRGAEHDRDVRTIRAEINVPTEQAGRLWRLTMPARQSVRFRMDPAVKQTLAHGPERWFEP